MLVQAVLEDWTTAAVDEQVRAMLGFLEKLTRRPTEVGPPDAAALRAAGISDEAAIDAVHVCALFTMINGLADALDFEAQSPESLRQSVANLLARGYRVV